MFNKKTREELEEEIVELKSELKDAETENKIRRKEYENLSETNRTTKADHAHELKEVALEYKLEHAQQEFDTKNATSTATHELIDKVIKLEKENAELKKENQMLDKIIDLNAGMIDIKNLVITLINKLPEIKITNLSLANGKEKVPTSRKN